MRHRRCGGDRRRTYRAGHPPRRDEAALRDLEGDEGVRCARPRQQARSGGISGRRSAITNLGMYGVREFSAIINPPHSTILAVGAARRQAVEKCGRQHCFYQHRCRSRCPAITACSMVRSARNCSRRSSTSSSNPWRCFELARMSEAKSGSSHACAALMRATGEIVRSGAASWRLRSRRSADRAGEAGHRKGAQFHIQCGQAARRKRAREILLGSAPRIRGMAVAATSERIDGPFMSRFPGWKSFRASASAMITSMPRGRVATASR